MSGSVFHGLTGKIRPDPDADRDANVIRIAS
jgi:hypothetical protein